MQKIDISPGQIFDGIHVRLLRVATGAITSRSPGWCRCGYPEFILIREGAVRSEFKEAPGRFIERPAHSIIHFPQDSIRRTWLASEERAPFVSLTFSARSDLLFDLLGLLEIPDFIRSVEAEEIMCRMVPLAGADTLADQLLVQDRQLRYNLASSYENYTTQKKNIEVSQKVFDNISNKFEHGYASSLEVTNASTTLLTAQSNYIQALLEMVNSHIELKKLLNE